MDWSTQHSQHFCRRSWTRSKISYLADEVRALLLVLLGDDDGTLEGGVIDLASLQLGHDLETALLLAVLVEGEGVVLLLRLARLALGLVTCGGSVGGGCVGRSGPSIGTIGGTGPLVGLSRGVGNGGSLGLELGVALVTTPALVDLLVRIAVGLKIG